VSRYATPAEERVLILAPTGKDARLSQAILAECGVSSTLCADVEAICRELEAGAGAALLSEEALHRGGLSRIGELLGRQPEWSDFPLLVLTGEGADSELALRTLETLGNVTLLERPVRVPALVSTVRAALRARRRQYQIREHLAEARRTADALREADRRKDEFLAILAHELRNPLAPLRHALETLRLAPESREAARWARDVMERQVTQMVRLIDDLLDLSRVSRGKIKLAREPLVLEAIVRDALEVSRPAIDAARHELGVSLPGELLTVEGDRTRLVQILCNLLSNAAKYTAPGGRISLEAHADGGEVVIAVADNGVGIPPDMLDRVFDMFTQVDDTLERSQGGLGIGLTLVKRLAELHGGAASAESAGRGCGSRFVVRLPLCARSAVPRAEPSPQAEGGESSRIRHRILVADDNRDAADSLASMLRLLGHEVCIAYDGAEAVALAETFRPRLALLDIGMPRLNGYEAARAIRARNERAKQDMLLVALTGWGQPEDKRRSKLAGFHHHLVKPVDPAMLARLLA
jgi:signal transduction histidine kinase